MKMMIFLAAVALAVTGCNDKPANTAKPTEQTNVGENPLNAPTDYLGAVAKAKRSADKTIDKAAITRAVQLFYAQEDRFPKDLEELVSMKYLGEIPTPPPGFKFNYNAANGDFSIIKQ